MIEMMAANLETKPLAIFAAAGWIGIEPIGKSLRSTPCQEGAGYD